MENSARNLMIFFAIVCCLSVIGAALNMVSFYNLRSLEVSPLTNKEVHELMSKGFLLRALLYLIIALTAIGALIKRMYSKSLLMILTIALISVFVFGPYIFDLLLGDSTSL